MKTSPVTPNVQKVLTWCLIAGLSAAVWAKTGYLAVEYKGGFRYLKADFKDSITFAPKTTPKTMTHHGAAAGSFDLSGVQSVAWLSIDEPAAPLAKITLKAGDAARTMAPFFFRLPGPFARHIPFLLASQKDTIVLQRDGADSGLVHGMLKGPLAADASLDYQLIRAVGNRPEPIEVNRKPDSIEVVKGSHRMFGYRTAIANPPGNIEKKFARSGYLHPLYGPTGKVISNDFPSDHPSHRGVFMAWSKGKIENRDVDFWDLRYENGTVRFKKINHLMEGPVFSELDLQLESMDLKMNTVAIDEAYRIRIYNLPGEERRLRMMDFRSIQKNVRGKDILLQPEQHGGFAFRGSPEWDHTNGRCEFLTSEGKKNDDAQAQPARWFLIKGGDNQGEWTSVGILSHPENFRHPEKLTVHRYIRMFCFTANRTESFTFKSGETKIFNFRMIVSTGKAEVAVIETSWKDFSKPLGAVVGSL